MSFRDRFFTRRTAEAIMAPSSILVGGAAAATGIALGAPIAAAAGVGAAAYAGWVALRMPRGRGHGTEAVDPGRLRDPWRRYVREALDSQTRFRQAVRGADAGPLRDRLETIGERIADGVRECWRIANRGQELEAALAQLVPAPEVEARIASLLAAPPSPTNRGLIDALRGQAETWRRIAAAASGARGRLEILDARLDEAVARAVELSLRSGDVGALGGLDEDVEALVTEMEALRRGLEEVTGQPATG
jgi:hypothetical protein